MQPFAIVLGIFLAALSTGAQITSAPVTLNVSNNQTTIDYSQTKFTGDPNIFGGNGVYLTPPSVGQAELTTYGNTTIRVFVSPNDIIPSTTNALYQAGMPSCSGASPCNPANWTWTNKNTDAYINLARMEGAKVLLNILGAAIWNDYSGTGSGVPNNFTVYNDYVAKFYQHWTPDFVEVGNEPDYSLNGNLTGSPYSTAQAAYWVIYKNAATAVRAISSTVLIGGPVICCDVASNWIPQFLTQATSNIPPSLINFVSYHNYMNNNNELFNGTNISQMVQASPEPTLPVWITEWNASGSCDTTDPDDGDANPSTVPFFGMRRVNMLNTGISKSFYWRLFGDDTGCSYYSSTLGAFNSKARVDQLMSVVLGLGAGSFKVNSSTNIGSTTAMGAINSAGQHVAVIVNKSGSTLTQIVTLENTLFTTNKTWNTYIADIANAATATPVESVSVSPSGGTVTHTISIPPNAVAGVLVQ